MRFLFLDTNALYNYIGRTNISSDFETTLPLDFEKFRNECNSEGTILSIADCCLMEAITLFKDKKQSVKVILNTVKNHPLMTISLTKHKIDVNAILTAIDQNDDEKYNQLIDYVISCKSEVESTWLYYIAAEISYIYVKALANEQADGCKDALIRLYESYVTSKLFSDEKNIRDRLITKYHKSSFGDKLVKSSAKEEFYSCIFYYCLIACSFAETYKYYSETGNTDITTEELKAKVEKTICTDLEKQKKEIRVVLAEKFAEQPSFYDETLKEMFDMLKEKKMSEIQAQYLKKIFNRVFSRNESNAFRDMAKNDIIDMISLGSISKEMLVQLQKTVPSLTMNDMFFVTFDGDLKDYISEVNDKNHSFINSFLQI